MASSREELEQQYLQEGYSPNAARARAEAVYSFQQGTYKAYDPREELAKQQGRAAKGQMIGEVGGIAGLLAADAAMGGTAASAAYAKAAGAGSKIASALGLGGGGTAAAGGAGAGAGAGGAIAAPTLISATPVSAGGLGAASTGVTGATSAGGGAGLGSLSVAGPVGLALLGMATGPQWAPKVADALGGISKKILGSKKKEPADWDVEKSFNALENSGYFDDISNSSIGGRAPKSLVNLPEYMANPERNKKGLFDWDNMARQGLKQARFRDQFGDVKGPDALNAVSNYFTSQGLDPSLLNMSDFDMLNINRGKHGLKLYESPDQVNEFTRQSLRQPGQSLEEALL
jgi:hypothetical protein